MENAVKAAAGEAVIDRPGQQADSDQLVPADYGVLATGDLREP